MLVYFIKLYLLIYMEVLVIIAVFIILTVIILYTVYQGVNVTICKGISTTMSKLHSVNNDRYLNLPQQVDGL